MGGIFCVSGHVAVSSRFPVVLKQVYCLCLANYNLWFPDKLRFKDDFLISSQHLNYLTQISLQLIQSFSLGMRPRKSWDIANIKREHVTFAEKVGRVGWTEANNIRLIQPAHPTISSKF